ncbi:MAG: efflux RND transporter periplasmic adaptor subunit [Bacillota bacterium]|nr:efflux RND transporter periplasmic adaptor subunit [Bacillota bacterium]
MTDGKMKNGKRRKKKIIIIGAAAVLAVAAAAFFLGGGASAGTPVSTGSAEYMDLRQVIPIKGAIQGAEIANVSSILDYKVAEVLVAEGDRVEQGQVLATLDVEEDTATDDTARQQARITLEEAKRVYENNQILFEAGAISESDYLQSKSAYESAQVAANAPSPQTSREDSRITSPIAGIVTRVNINVGRYASDTVDREPMFVVEDLDHLQMKVSASEYDIGSIRVGQSVEISAEVLGKQTVPGVVSYISPTGESKGDGTTAMVIPVLIDVDKGESNLIAGVTARAEILVEEKQNVLTVPLDAILEDPSTGELSVFVVQADSTLRQVQVETGLEGDFNIEIVSGELKEGDQVVLGATFDLTDGMTVLADAAAGSL